MPTYALVVAVAVAASLLSATAPARCGPSTEPAAPADRAGPLAWLPSRPGEHVTKVKAMKDDAWLDLGTPAPDPKWGTARGRSWGARMAYAPDLRAAFLFGEGVHGWWDQETGRYMDDLWAYDCNAHRWVCVYPGADVNHLDLKLNDHGVEVTKDGGDPLPVAQMVHAYQGTTYDADRRRFLFMPCSGGYWDKAMGGRRMGWLGEKRNEVAKNCGPWEYDTRTNQWDRRPTAAPGPRGGFGEVLEYVTSLKRVFLRTGGEGDVWWYDPAKNEWSKASPKGPPPPFGIDPTACYDTKRDRLYVGGGSYPVAKGPNALWAYDVKADTWIDLKPAGTCCGGSNRYNTNIAVMTYDQAADAVVLMLHKNEAGGTTGLWVYRPDANAWDETPRPFPDGVTWKQVNGFYDPDLNVHVYHSAGDSQPDGIIRVYRLRPKASG